MTPSIRKKSALKSAETFSLVPHAVQRKLYEQVLRASLVRRLLDLEDRVHTDFAEIGALAALTDSDPVFPFPQAIGARVARLGNLANIHAELLQHGQVPHPVSTSTAAESLLTWVIAHILPDPKLMATISTGEFIDGPAWANVLRFVGQHRLPILFIVPGKIASREDSSADLRTIYAEFGVPVMTTDAHDPIAAFRVATEALHNARAKRGATILEAALVETSQPALNSRPPLEQLEEFMRRKGSWDDAWHNQIETATRLELDELEARSA